MASKFGDATKAVITMCIRNAHLNDGSKGKEFCAKKLEQQALGEGDLITNCTSSKHTFLSRMNL